MAFVTPGICGPDMGAQYRAGLRAIQALPEEKHVELNVCLTQNVEPKSRLADEVSLLKMPEKFCIQAADLRLGKIKGTFSPIGAYIVDAEGNRKEISSDAVSVTVYDLSDSNKTQYYYYATLYETAAGLDKGVVTFTLLKNSKTVLRTTPRTSLYRVEDTFSVPQVDMRIECSNDRCEYVDDSPLIPTRRENRE